MDFAEFLIARLRGKLPASQHRILVKLYAYERLDSVGIWYSYARYPPTPPMPQCTSACAALSQNQFDFGFFVPYFDREVILFGTPP